MNLGQIYEMKVQIRGPEFGYTLFLKELTLSPVQWFDQDRQLTKIGYFANKLPRGNNYL